MDRLRLFTSFFIICRHICLALALNQCSEIMNRRTYVAGNLLFLSKVVTRDNASWPGGTNLPLLTLEEAAQQREWNMGRWPDPILRHPASPVPAEYFGTKCLETVVRQLKETAVRENAVGLAAEQSGVDARIIYLQGSSWFEPELFLINPRIVGRSDEIYMKSWEEFCLVLPPSFRATVLRDAQVTIEYQEWQTAQSWKRLTLRGEQARAFQHEFDHDRGILITDHVPLDSMGDEMRKIEEVGHSQRMRRAYDREIELSAQ